MSEQGDDILLVTLRRGGVAVPPALKSLADIRADVLVTVSVSLVRLLGAGKYGDLQDVLPVSMGGKIKACTAIANAIRECGYAADFGYNQLMYPNPADARRMLSFLSSKLPRKDEEDGAAGAAGAGSAGAPSLLALLSRNFRPFVNAVPGGGGAGAAATPSSALQASCKAADAVAAGAASAQLFGATAAAPARTALQAALLASSAEAAAGGAAAGESTAALLQQALLSGLDAAARLQKGEPLQLPSLDSLQAVGAVSVSAAAAAAAAAATSAATAQLLLFPGTALDSLATAFTRRTAFLVAPPVGAAGSLFGRVGATGAGQGSEKTEEELAAEREAELAAIAARIAALEQLARGLAEQQRLLTDSVLPPLRLQLEEAAGARREQLEKQFLARKDTLAMLPEAAAHLARLTAEVEASSNRLLELAAAWEGKRVPLLQAIEQQLVNNGSREAEVEELRARVEAVRAQLKELGSSVAGKDEQAGRLAAELARLKETLGQDAEMATRGAYTLRILDIVRQIRKQKAEIGRIVKDVRVVQQEINSVSDKLQRTARVATDTMEKAAVENNNSKDPAFRQTLRSLLTLQELFQQLITATSSLGNTENEMRDLENKIEQLSSRNDASRLEQLSKDLAEIRQDNAQLQQQLQQAAGGRGAGGAAGGE